MLRIRLRFAVWVGVVVALSVGQAAWIVGGRPVAGLVVGEVVVGVMVWLLATTPAGAIKLKRGVSEGVILAGAAGLQGVAGNGWVYGVVVFVGCAVMLGVMRWRGASPWWAAVGAWNPIVVGGVAALAGGAV